MSMLKPRGIRVVRADRLAAMFAPATVDIFAGLGGWSIGAEQAFVEGGAGSAGGAGRQGGRDRREKYIDLMINHWDVAVGVHQVNHPLTEHLHADVLEVDPAAVLPGRRIAYLHASPDCTDHSKAKGGKPRRKEIRALADVVVVWAGKRRPDVITLENVEEFQQWGPLLASGHPDPRRRGEEFRRWVRELESLGYEVEWRELRACDYGAPTTRKRLFVIARCDGKPIIWPEATHGSAESGSRVSVARSRKAREGVAKTEDGSSRDFISASLEGSNSISGSQPAGSGDLPRGHSRHRKLKPYRTAAECIDWSVPMLSIFASRREARAWAAAHNAGRAGEQHDRIGVPQRPLKLNTQKRLAGGLLKWVLGAAEPFIVNIANYGWDSSANGQSVLDPLTTVTAGPRGGKHAVADVQLAAFSSTLNHGGDEHRSADLREPINTVTAARDARAVVGASFVASPAHSKTTGRGRYHDSLADPLKTTTGVNDKVLVTAQLAPFTIPRYGERDGQVPRSGSVAQPLPTVTPTDNGAQLVAVALNKHNLGVVGQPADRPIGTVTGIDHHSLLAVHLTQYHAPKDGGVRGEVRGQDLRDPLKTLDTQNRFGPVAAHLVKFRGTSNGNSLADPMPTVTSGAGAERDAGAAHALGLGAVYLSHMYTSNSCGGQGDPRKPAKCITSGGQHGAVCVVWLQPYYGQGSGLTGHTPADPLPTAVGTDRFSLAAVETAPPAPSPHWVLTPAQLRRARRVANWARRMLGAKVTKYLLPVRDAAGKVFYLLTVAARGALHLVTDILMRMLRPRELARAQGFDDGYVIDRTASGQRISKADQVKLIGNSVPPAFARAIVKANVVDSGVLDDEPVTGRRAVPA